MNMPKNDYILDAFFVVFFIFKNVQPQRKVEF